jgi:hypothetical protein
MDIIENVNRLEDYLINESEMSLTDIQKISIYLINIREEAINYTRCCKSDSEQLKCNHTWIVNHHQGTRYCSKGCDNFEKHTF